MAVKSLCFRPSSVTNWLYNFAQAMSPLFYLFIKNERIKKSLKFGSVILYSDILLLE